MVHMVLTSFIGLFLALIAYGAFGANILSMAGVSS
jgi:hypothetical protein